MKHMTVTRKGDETPRPVRIHENFFKCPFCSPELYKPAGYPKIATHLASHKLKAINHKDYIIYSCGLDCGGKAKHFHCCYCSKTYINKREMLKHLALHCPDDPCQPSAATPGPSKPVSPAVATPGLSTPGPPAAATPGPSTSGPPAAATPGPSTSGPPAAATPGPSTSGPPAAATPGPSTPGPPAVPTPGPSTPGPPAVPTPGPFTSGPPAVPTPGSSTPGPPAVPTPGSSTSGPPAVPTPGSSITDPPAAATPGPSEAPADTLGTCKQPQIQHAEQNLKKDLTQGVVTRKQIYVQCPHCNLTVNKKNLKIHIERRHTLHVEDITATHHLKVQRLDRPNRIYAVAKPFRGPPAPVQVVLTGGNVRKKFMLSTESPM